MDYRCNDCEHEFNPPRGADRLSLKCPNCGSAHWGLIPQRGPNTIVPADWSWTGENSGRGKYISGLGKRSDPDAYCKTLREAEDKAKAKNLNYERH